MDYVRIKSEMSEVLTTDPDLIGQIQKEYQDKRVEALGDSGFKGWFLQIESEINQRLVPSLTNEEGLAIARKFGNLSELTPSQSPKNTETPIMNAITDDLRIVFEEEIEPEINTLVVEQLMPLRGKEDAETSEPNKYLVMAVKNILRDVVAVARVFQLTDNQLKELYPEEDPEQMRAASLVNLELSLLIRSRKGQARERGLCRKPMHKEHVWILRGTRDVPPTSLEVIGEFIDNHLVS